MVCGLRWMEYGREEGDEKDDDARGPLGGECAMQKGDNDNNPGNIVLTKCMIAFFRFRSRKVANAFWKWKFAHDKVV